jgi:chromosome segregation ATPase
LLTKRIKDDREHWDGCREHNNELVAANAEIYQSLRHWGLEQSEPCSLVNNVKQVIQLCAERGKKIEELNGNVKALQFNINVINESNISDQGDLRKRIAELEKHAASRQVIIDQLNADLASANTDIGNQDRELADKDAKYQRLQQVCDDLRRRRAEGCDESQKLLKKIADLEKVIDVMSKQQPSGDRGTLRAIISQLKSENELLCERIKHRLDESKTLSASIHKSRERIEELMETVNGHADVVAEKNRSIESLNADCSRLALEIKQKDKVISALNDRITLSGEAMTMLGVDNKKLNEALETLSSVNQKIADNVAKLRHEKDSDEASYIKKLADKSLRIAVLKKAGNDLCACLKRYHYSDTQQPHVVSALRNWEKEAR